MIEMLVERLMQAEALSKEAPLAAQLARALGGTVSDVAQDGLEEAALLVRFADADSTFSEARVTSRPAVSDGRDMVRVVLSPRAGDASLDAVSAEPEKWKRGPRLPSAPGQPLTRFWSGDQSDGLTIGCATRAAVSGVIDPLICTVSWR